MSPNTHRQILQQLEPHRGVLGRSFVQGPRNLVEVPSERKELLRGMTNGRSFGIRERRRVGELDPNQGDEPLRGAVPLDSGAPLKRRVFRAGQAKSDLARGLLSAMRNAAMRRGA